MVTTIKVNDNMVSDGTLTLQEIASQGGYASIDALKQDIQNGSLNLDFSECTKNADADSTTDIIIDLMGSGLDLTYLMINDNGLDINLKEDDSDDFIIIRNSSMDPSGAPAGSSNANSKFITSFTIDGNNSTGANHLYSDLSLEIGDLQTSTKSDDNDGLGEDYGEVYANYYNFVNEITGDLIIQSSKVTVKGDQSIKQNSSGSADANIDGVVDVHLSITNNYGGTNVGFTTDLLYDISLTNEVSAGLDELSTLVAGLDLHINNTGNFNILAGSQLNVNTNSTLGDTKQESWIATLKNYQSANPTAIIKLNGVSMTLLQLSAMTETELETAIKNGTLTITLPNQTEATEGSDEWIAGTATGNWHSFSLTTDKSKNNPANSGGTFYVPQDVMDAIVKATGKTQAQLEAGGLTNYGGGTLDLSSFTVTEGTYKDIKVMDLIAGGTSGGTSTTGDKILTISITDTNDYGLKIGSEDWDSGAKTTPIPGEIPPCRNCDPIAMIHIENLGGTGSLYASATNTADILGLGVTTLDKEGTFTIDGYASTQGIQFQTGIKIEKDEEKSSVAGQVQLDITEKGKQDRTKAKITGQFVNEAGVKLSTGDSHSNIGTLGKLNYTENFGTQVSDAVMEELMGYFQPTGSYDINDVESWIGDSDVVACIIDNGIKLADSMISDIAEIMVSNPSALSNSGISPTELVSLIYSSFATFDPFLTQALTDNIDGNGGFYDQVALELLANTTSSTAMTTLLDKELSGNNADIISFIKNNSTNTSIINYCSSGNQERSQNIWDKVMTDLNTNSNMTTLALRMLSANTSIMGNVLDGEFSSSGASNKVKDFILNNYSESGINSYVTTNNAGGTRLSSICSYVIFPNLSSDSAKNLLTSMLSHAMSTTDTKWASALDNAILGEIGMNNNLDKFILDNVTNAPVLSFLLSNLSDSGFQSFLSNELATQISDGGKLLDLMNAFIMGGSSLSGYQFELREGVTTSDWQNGLLAVLGSAYKMSFNQSGLTVIPGQYSKDEYSNIRDTINKGKENATDSEKKARSILLKFIDWKTSSKNSLKELLENMIIDNTPH